MMTKLVVDLFNFSIFDLMHVLLCVFLCYHSYLNELTQLTKKLNELTQRVYFPSDYLVLVRGVGSTPLLTVFCL